MRAAPREGCWDASQDTRFCASVCLAGPPSQLLLCARPMCLASQAGCCTPSTTPAAAPVVSCASAAKPCTCGRRGEAGGGGGTTSVARIVPQQRRQYPLSAMPLPQSPPHHPPNTTSSRYCDGPCGSHPGVVGDTCVCNEVRVHIFLSPWRAALSGTFVVPSLAGSVMAHLVWCGFLCTRVRVTLQSALRIKAIPNREDLLFASYVNTYVPCSTTCSPLPDSSDTGVGAA